MSILSINVPNFRFVVLLMLVSALWSVNPGVFVQLNVSCCIMRKKLSVSNTAGKTKDKSGNFEFNSLLQ